MEAVHNHGRFPCLFKVEFPLSPNAGVAKKAIILLTDGAATDGVFIPKA